MVNVVPFLKRKDLPAQRELVLGNGGMVGVGDGSFVVVLVVISVVVVAEIDVVIGEAVVLVVVLVRHKVLVVDSGKKQWLPSNYVSNVFVPRCLQTNSLVTSLSRQRREFELFNIHDH